VFDKISFVLIVKNVEFYIISIVIISGGETDAKH